MSRRGLSILIAVCALFPCSAYAVPITIDFEQFSDLESVGSAVPHLTFTNATVLVAGSSLNEFEFPPASGLNVVFDDGGPLSIMFATPISSFSGLFTYVTPVTLSAFDSAGNLITSFVSAFSTNLGESGDPGSVPNELLQLSSAAGISSIVASGDSLGGSFALDDVTFEELENPVPEPGTISLLGLGCFGLARALRGRRRADAPASRRPTL